MRASGTICRSRVASSLDVLHAVVDEVDLPLPVQFPQHGRADQLLAEARDAGLDRQAVFGRRFQVGDVAGADQAHVQRPRDRRGGHRQHVDRLPHRLEPLLDLDAEPLLLVDDDQAQVVELHVGLHEPVRADDDVDGPAGQPLDDLALLPPRGEPREGGDGEGELGHPRGEGPQVLLGQHGRRHEHRHLVARVDRLERRPHGDLGLAVAHVAAEQAVHRPRGLHVLLDRLQGGQLVGRFLEGERGVEFVLPLGIDAEADARPRRPHGLQFEHLGGHVGDGRFDPLLLLVPEPPAQPGQRRPALRPADVLLHQADLRDRHVELRLAVEFQFQVLLDLAVLLQQLHAAIAGDAVAEMHHQIAFVQFEEAVDRAAQMPPRGGRPLHVGAAEQLAAAEQRRSDQAPAGNRFAACRWRSADGRRGRSASSPKTSPRRRTSASVWQMRNTSWPRPASSSSSRTLSICPLNRSTDSIGRRQVVSSEPVAMADAVTEGNCDRPADHVRRRYESLAAAPAVRDTAGLRSPARPARPAGTSFAAEDNRPGARLACPSGRGARVTVRLTGTLPLARFAVHANHRRHINRLQPLVAPLALHLERPDRFDLVAEQLDPHRLEPVGSEDIDDPAAAGELAGQFHRRRVLVAAA